MYNAFKHTAARLTINHSRQQYYWLHGSHGLLVLILWQQYLSAFNLWVTLLMLTGHWLWHYRQLSSSPRLIALGHINNHWYLVVDTNPPKIFKFYPQVTWRHFVIGYYKQGSHKRKVVLFPDSLPDWAFRYCYIKHRIPRGTITSLDDSNQF